MYLYSNIVFIFLWINKDEGELLDKVVDDVFKKGVKTHMSVATYPTGWFGWESERFWKENIKLQHEHSRWVQIVSITHLGGVGKTPLAKKLFNKESSNYKKSYFLADIREKDKGSLHSLQSEVLRGLDNRHQGIEILMQCFVSSKVLLL